MYISYTHILFELLPWRTLTTAPHPHPHVQEQALSYTQRPELIRYADLPDRCILVSLSF